MGFMGIDFKGMSEMAKQSMNGSVQQAVGGGAAKGGAEATVSIFEEGANIGKGLTSGLADMGIPKAILNPLDRMMDGAVQGAQAMSNNVSNMVNSGYLPSAGDRLGAYPYYQYGANGQMVGVSGFNGDGSIGGVAASLGLFSPEEAQLFSLIHDPLQRQMFLIDKRMKQQSLLCSMLTNIMAAKQDVLKEMGRNLRT
ncbi:MAG: hypothetical protein K1X64_09710 [Myxococcaceae bacterium]|nr:hypothetical protein [Myxococcaceae bacterium]